VQGSEGERREGWRASRPSKQSLESCFRQARERRVNAILFVVDGWELLELKKLIDKTAAALPSESSPKTRPSPSLAPR